MDPWSPRPPIWSLVAGRSDYCAPVSLWPSNRWTPAAASRSLLVVSRYGWQRIVPGRRGAAPSPSGRERGKKTAQRPKNGRPNGLSNSLSGRPFNAPPARGRTRTRPRPPPIALEVGASLFFKAAEARRPVSCLSSYSAISSIPVRAQRSRLPSSRRRGRGLGRLHAKGAATWPSPRPRRADPALPPRRAGRHCRPGGVCGLTRCQISGNAECASAGGHAFSTSRA